MTLSATAIIPAAGFGTRMKTNHPKQYQLLAGVPILVHTVRAFASNNHIDEIVVVVPADRLHQTRELFAEFELDTEKIVIVQGGKRRQDSVQAGLKAVSNSQAIVLVHDGARPLVSQAIIDRCYRAAADSGAAIAAVPVKDTLKRGSIDATVSGTVDRTLLWQAQTPQAALKILLEKAFAQNGDEDVTDESSLLEKAGIPVSIVEGAETNIKITRPEDLLLAENILAQQSQPQLRIGHGYDAHRFAETRKLILGGIEVPHARGLAGHSDADALTHALCDAILGALGQGDIGRHFPDTDQKFAGTYSITLLQHVIQLAKEQRYAVTNADITIVCQAPRLAPHLEKMKELLGRTCNIQPDFINIKATTTEKMGFTGREEGISCHAVVLLHQETTQTQ